MSETELLRKIEADLQSAPKHRVLYLEGESDAPLFFALLGTQVPVDGLYQGVLVKGLREEHGKQDRAPGTGKAAVQARVELALRKGLRGVFGILDGDGLLLSELADRFDKPEAGPLFSWKAYCIENLLVQAAWPADWGTAPDWTDVLLGYVPYVALNRVHRELRLALATLGLDRYKNPQQNAPLLTVTEVLQALEQDKHLIKNQDVARLFTEAAREVEAAVRSSLAEGHALVNGKWLVDVFAAEHIHKTPKQCREHWAAYLASSGGLSDVVSFWRRIA